MVHERLAEISMPTTIGPREKALLVSEVKQKSESRSLFEAPIEVSGFNSHERFFTQRTSAGELSDNGCKFHLRSEVVKNSVVSVRLLRTHHGPEPDSRVVLFPVLSVEKAGNRWMIGVEKLQPIRLWLGLEPDHPKTPSEMAPVRR
jgi:hypothetical protein